MAISNHELPEWYGKLSEKQKQGSWGQFPTAPLDSFQRGFMLAVWLINTKHQAPIVGGAPFWDVLTTSLGEARYVRVDTNQSK